MECFVMNLLQPVGEVDFYQLRATTERIHTNTLDGGRNCNGY